MNPSPHPPSSAHKRKISFADLSTTFRRAGPIYAPQSQSHPHPSHPSAQQAQAHQQAQQLAAQQAQQQLAAIRHSEASRNKATRPTDRNIPDELAEVVVGDGVQRYEKLRAVERRLDALMMRKRLDVGDNLQRKYTRREGILRVWVSNTAEGQAWQVMQEEEEGAALDFGDASAATFRVRVEGRLLEDAGDAAAGEKERKDAAADQAQDSSAPEKEERAQHEKKDPRRPRLSHFFKSITVDFDRNPALQPDNYSAIEWRKPTPSSPGYDPNSSDVSFDTLEFERKGDDNINITISLVRDEKHERFKLSPLLAEILDTEEEDRAGAVQGIWEYCRAMGLQEDEDRRSIVCDEQLRRVSRTTHSLPPSHTHKHPLTLMCVSSSSKKTNSTSPTSRTCCTRTCTPSPPSNSPTPSASTNSTSLALPLRHPQSTTSASRSPTHSSRSFHACTAQPSPQPRAAPP